jgi:dipeptidyl aminopeptidase/acylaminoacyl peptidase
VPLPAVLLVHGGPWVRDTWGFHAVVQWLANRGYAVIQCNYRGSAGYGKDLLNAGDRQWGAAMQDDLHDAVGWAVAQGHVDPARVAIFGSSYGGYAALVGVAFTPHRFACAVAVCPPSDLNALLTSYPPYWKAAIQQAHRRVGNPATDKDFLWSRSPLSRVGDIQAPVMLVQGLNDPRVPREHSEQIVAALRQREVPVQYLPFEDEGHGLAKPENRLAFYAIAQEFLATHIGTGNAPVQPTGVVGRQ